MVSVLASSTISHEPRSGQIKDYKIGIYCFSAKHTAIRRKSKDWVTRNQDNMSRVRRYVYPWTVVPTKRVGLEQSGPDHLIENYLVLVMI